MIHPHDTWCNVSCLNPVGCDGCSCTAGRMIDDLRAQLAKAEAVVKQLPHTADGVPVISDGAAFGQGVLNEPMFIYYIDCGSVKPVCAPGSQGIDISECYSTKEKCQAAIEAA